MGLLRAMRAALPRAGLMALASLGGGCLWLLDTDGLQGEPAATTPGAGGAGAGGVSGSSGQGGGGSGEAGAGGDVGGAGGSDAGSAGVGGSEAGAGGDGGSGGGVGVSCATSLQCDEGDPCTLDTCVFDGKSCDEVSCVGADGAPLGQCERAPWAGEGFRAELPAGPLASAKLFGQPVMATVADGFVVGAHQKGDTDDVVLVRLSHDGATKKVLLSNVLSSELGSKGLQPRSSPALLAVGSNLLLVVFGVSDDKGGGGLVGALLDATTLGKVAVEAISQDGYKASAQALVPQVFASSSDGTQFVVQWVGPASSSLFYAGLVVKGNKLTPPTKLNEWKSGEEIKALAAVSGVGTSWGALVMHGGAEAWHPPSESALLQGSTGVAKPAGMSAARLADGLALAAYGDGTPQSGGNLFVRLIACDTKFCEVGSLQEGGIGSEEPSAGLYPALHAQTLAGPSGALQFVVANVLYPEVSGKTGYVGVFSVNRVKLTANAQGVSVEEAPPVNPRFALFPDGLETQKDVTTPRTLPAVHVDPSGRVGVVWVEGAEGVQSLQFIRYGVSECPPAP